jgi:NADH-quinone oxidoreductase subunit N
MNLVLAAAKAPDIDWAGLSPLLAAVGGSVLVLLVGLLRSRFVREAIVPVLTIASLGAMIGLSIWQWDEGKDIISSALRIDTLAMYLNVLFGVTGIATVLLSWRAEAPRESAHGEYYSMLLASIAGMTVLVAAQNTLALFIGFELLSIPLYVLCATEMRRARSLESGLKYLVIGSVGSATLVYGLALLYGATGTTFFRGMAEAVGSEPVAGDSLLLAGIALVVVGLAFKASVAPFHQWTPDVYEGAPTPITAFMAIATKAAAFGVLIRIFDVALLPAQDDWGPALAALATITIVVGNVGALGQTSLKRLLAWSSVAQAGYLMAGVLVGTRLGVQATAFYLAVYLVMNLAAFAAVIARERQTRRGDHIDSVAGIGWDRPELGWPLTIAMLGLAGMPATGGFFGKIYLINAAVDGGYAWLGIVIVLGSAASLAYYLRVVVAVWSRPATAAAPAAVRARPALAGGSQDAPVSGPDDRDSEGDERLGETEPGERRPPTENPGARGTGPGQADQPGGTGRSGETFDDDAGRGLDDAGRSGDPRGRQLEVAFVAVAAAIATVVLGVIPGPLLDLVRDVGPSLGRLLS